VIPALAIADAINAFNKSAKIFYIGSYNGIEKTLVKNAGIKYVGISTGKFRRYFDVQNLFDLLRIPWGIIQAFWVLWDIKPKVIFSKGGFVGLPVVIAGWLHKIPVVIHDSDSIPGLATKLSAPFAKKILLAFETAEADLYAYRKKIEVVGNPIRLSLFEGKRARGIKMTGFDGKRPVLLVMGGSSGAQQLNILVQKEKENLTRDFDIIHLSGTGKGSVKKEKHYVEFPYVEDGMRDLYAITNLALTRAGANTIAELNALQIPALLYPLGTHASRGDQMANAQIMAEESSLFMIADEDKDPLNQLLLLPARSNKILGDGVTQKVALILLSYV